MRRPRKYQWAETVNQGARDGKPGEYEIYPPIDSEALERVNLVFALNRKSIFFFRGQTFYLTPPFSEEDGYQF